MRDFDLVKNKSSGDVVTSQRALLFPVILHGENNEHNELNMKHFHTGKQCGRTQNCIFSSVWEPIMSNSHSQLVTLIDGVFVTTVTNDPEL